MSDPNPSASAPERPTIYAMLADRARRTSDGGLAACTAAGLLALATLIGLQPRWWPPLVPVIALGAFGAWGIADRELASRPAAGGGARGAGAALRIVKWASAAIGTLAAVFTGIWLMALALGRLIS